MKWKQHVCWEYVPEDPGPQKGGVLVDKIIHGLKDKMNVPSKFVPLRAIAVKHSGDFRIGLIDLKTRELLDLVHKSPVAGMIWRDVFGSFGPVIMNPECWSMAQSMIRWDDLIPSSSWIPKGAPKEVLEERDDRYDDSKVYYEYKGRSMFRHIRAIVVEQGRIYWDADFAKCDLLLRKSRSLSRKEWISFFETGSLLNSSFKLHCEGLKRGVSLRDPNEIRVSTW